MGDFLLFSARQPHHSLAFIRLEIQSFQPFEQYHMLDEPVPEGMPPDERPTHLSEILASQSVVESLIRFGRHCSLCRNASMLTP